MGSLTLTMFVVVVLGIICIKVTLKSTYEPPAPWECVTCGESNVPSVFQCSQCGMERQA
jgi:hypothetical protein